MPYLLNRKMLANVAYVSEGSVSLSPQEVVATSISAIKRMKVNGTASRHYH